MSSVSPANFSKEHGLLGYLHYLVFPLDLFITGDEAFEAGREQRVNELTPILFWLIPLLIVLAGTTSLAGLGIATLFLFEIAVLVFLSAIYCWRASIGFLLELTVNYAVSFIVLGIFLYALITLVFSLGFVVIVVGIIILYNLFFRNSGYDNDDDW